MNVEVTITINGATHKVQVPPRTFAVAIAARRVGSDRHPCRL